MFQIKQLNLGGILDQSIAIMKAKFGLLLAITLVTVVPLQFLTGMLQLVIFPGLAQGDPSAVQANLGLYFAVVFGAIALSILVTPLANAAVIYAVACTYLSQPVTLGSCLRHGLRRWPALIGTTLLMSLIIGVGSILIIPGVIFFFWYFLAQQVTVLEDVAGGAALSRSKELMKGNKLTALALILMVGVINIAGSIVMGLIPQIHLNILGQSVLFGISTLFAAAVFVVFYFSCRCKLENFDLVMLADAVADEDASAAPLDYDAIR